MGGETFFDYEWGKTAEEAFKRAVENAQWHHGHGGYTGTIAEKSTFIMIPLPTRKTPMDYADQLIEDDDERIADKWGDAGCIEVPKDCYEEIFKDNEPLRPTPTSEHKSDEKLFLFFGWAQSLKQLHLIMSKNEDDVTEVAHSIIDDVEETIRGAFPVIDKFAESRVIDGEKPNTLLYGEIYYDLEDGIKDKLEKYLTDHWKECARAMNWRPEDE